MHPEIANICRKIAYTEGLEDAEIDVNLKINSLNLKIAGLVST